MARQAYFLGLYNNVAVGSPKRSSSLDLLVLLQKVHRLFRYCERLCLSLFFCSKEETTGYLMYVLHTSHVVRLKILKNLRTPLL